MSSTFGELLVSLRKKQKLSQKQLGINIGYSKIQIYRIEKNLFNPSIDLLQKLSSFYNIDLYNFFKFTANDFSIDTFKNFHKLREAIMSKNNPLIIELIDEYENLTTFKKGENLKLIKYSKALIAMTEQNYDLSLQIAFEGLKISNISLDEDFSKVIFSDTSYYLIIHIGLLYYFLNDFNKAKELYEQIYQNLSSNFFKTPIEDYYTSEPIIRAYLIVINNLSTIYLELNHNELALELLETGIDYAVETKNITTLIEMYYTKFECEYKLNDFQKAKKTFDYTISLCDILKEESLKIQYLKNIETNFQNI